MAETNALVARSSKPVSKRFLTKTAQIYTEQFSNADGKAVASFEILWLTGWANHPDQQKPLKPGSAKTRDVASWLGTLAMITDSGQLLITNIEGKKAKPQSGGPYKDVIGANRKGQPALFFALTESGELRAFIEADDNGNFKALPISSCRIRVASASQWTRRQTDWQSSNRARRHIWPSRGLKAPCSAFTRQIRFHPQAALTLSRGSALAGWMPAQAACGQRPQLSEAAALIPAL